MRYRNLDIEAVEHRIENGCERFKVRVTSSPAGDQRPSDAEPVVLPTELRHRRARLLARRDITLAEMIALGEELATALLPASVRSLLDRSLERLGDDEGLRIRLKLDTYALADLPWEYLYVAPPNTPTGQKGIMGFLALNRQFSLVRYEVLEQSRIDVLEPIGPGPLRLVVVLARPPGYAELNLGAEEDNIQSALSKLREKGLCSLEFYRDATIVTLEEALGSSAHILHFSGHGKFESDMGVAYGSLTGAGSLILHGEIDAEYSLRGDRLANNLRKRGLRLVVLGACDSARRDQVNAWTGIAPTLTLVGIPAVVGMQYSIRDPNAIAFSRAFYRTLAEGEPIDTAVSNGRLAIMNRDNQNDDERDWGVPVLYMRTEDAVLFRRAQRFQLHPGLLGPAFNLMQPGNQRCHNLACRLPIERGTLHCPNCGSELLWCGNCGSILRPPFRFCTRCGLQAEP